MHKISNMYNFIKRRRKRKTDGDGDGNDSDPPSSTITPPHQTISRYLTLYYIERLRNLAGPHPIIPVGNQPLALDPPFKARCKQADF